MYLQRQVIIIRGKLIRHHQKVMLLLAQGKKIKYEKLMLTEILRGETMPTRIIQIIYKLKAVALKLLNLNKTRIKP